MENFLGSHGESWNEQLTSLKDVIKSSHELWVEPELLLEILGQITNNLPEDLEELDQEARFIFSASSDMDSLTDQNVALIRRCHYLNKAPSLTALCILAIESFGLEITLETTKAILMASILGEVQNTNPYHNNMHFKKVLLQTIRMVATHNDIYKGTPRAFDDEQIAMLLMGACVHDIGHDGQGNTVKGVFLQGRLEQQSFDLAKPYLEAVGYGDEDRLESLNVMLLCTDTAPLGELSNPMNQMKAAYRYHYLGGKEKTHALNLDEELSLIQKDEKLALLCLILHEADIATSAGLSYEVTKYETSIFMAELRGEDAYPEQVIDFLNQICQKQMLSDAGQRLYAANLARIYALAEADVEAGNHAFPSPEHSDLMLSVSSESGDGSRTIN